MSNLLNQSVESAPLSWLQSNSGEWQYFVDKVLVDESSSSVFTQDYIWLVSQAITSHKVSGYRIANQTMENFIEQLAGVEQAIVFGVPHEHKGNALHVYIESVFYTHLTMPTNRILSFSGVSVALKQKSKKGE